MCAQSCTFNLRCVQRDQRDQSASQCELLSEILLLDDFLFRLILELFSMATAEVDYSMPKCHLLNRGIVAGDGFIVHDPTAIDNLYLLARKQQVAKALHLVRLRSLVEEPSR